MDYFSWLGTYLREPGFWFQPIFYAAHGWLATEMALLMLFRPYEPVFIPWTKIQLPFTPGIFPRGRHKLSVAIANTVTEMLLTRDDIQRQAEKLVTEENIYQALDVVVESVTTELRDVSHLQAIYRHVDRLVPPLLEKLANDMILSLEADDNQVFEGLADRFFAFALSRLHLGREQAVWFVDLMFSTILTPSYLRTVMAEGLSDETIEEINNALKRQVKGLRGVLMSFIDVKKGIYDFKYFLLGEPETAEQLILEMEDRLEVREKLVTQVMQFSPRQLPAESLEELRRFMVQYLRGVLVENREEIAGLVGSLSAEATHTLTNHLLQIDFKDWGERTLPGFKRDVARFVHTYLSKELENMVSRALPAIGLNTVIVDKIDRFSAKELEQTIQRICHRELRWLAYLGAFLGLWLGLLSNLAGYWIHPAPVK